MAQDDYMLQMHNKLESARKRLNQGQEVKALKASAPTLFEIIDGEISIVVNSLTQDKPLPYDEYLSAHGQVRGILKIRNLLDSKEAEAVQAKQEVTAIEENIENIRNDQKQS